VLATVAVFTGSPVQRTDRLAVDAPAAPAAGGEAFDATTSEATTGTSAPRETASAPAAATNQRTAETAGQGHDAADIPAEAGGTGSAAMLLREPAALEVTLSVQRSVEQDADRHELTLRACNPEPRAVEVWFPAAQRYDFEVARDGAVVWRWSAGRSFAQVAADERWEPKSCKEWTESWNGTTDKGGPADPGRYQVTGVLAADPQRRTEPQEACRVACL
jgi:hypothetical protein